MKMEEWSRAEKGQVIVDMTYQECTEYIESIPLFTKKTDLANTVKLLDLLGVDRGMSGIIHVAGTNGKGSVCTFLSRMLGEAGYSVGLFLSPHLVDLRERIQIQNLQVSQEDFCRACEKVKQISSQMVQEGYLHPAYFEFLFGMAMFLFTREHLDYIILETGLGGRLDATNVFFKPLLSVITPISLDHTEILGDSLEKIAREKAGIIKEGTPVVYWGTEVAVSEVIEKIAQGRNASVSDWDWNWNWNWNPNSNLNSNFSSKIYKITEKDYKILKIHHKSIDFCMNYGYYGNSNFSLPFPAAYQAANGTIALTALEILTKAQPIPADMIQNAFAKVSWQGRMEEVLPRVFADGAHNEAGIAAFMEAVRGIPQDGKRVLLFSVVKEKKAERMIQILCEQSEFSTVILTEVEGNRKTELQLLQNIFSDYTKAEILCISDTKEAFETGILRKGENGTLFCVGSLYLVGQIKAGIKEKMEDDYD